MFFIGLGLIMNISEKDKSLFEHFGISGEFKVRNQPEYFGRNLAYFDQNFGQHNFEVQQRAVVFIQIREIEYDRLLRVLTSAKQYDTLMRDPQTRAQVNELNFILSLNGQS